MSALSRESEEFLSWLSVEKGRSQNTLRAYRRDLNSYESFLKSKHKNVKTASEATIESYIAEQKGDGKAPTSLARSVVAVRSLYRFCNEEGLLKRDPAQSVGRPRIPRSLPKALSESEVEQLILAVTGNSPTDRRDRAMLETLYGTGIRISELVGLSIADVSFESHTLRVFGKGSKERIVPLGRMARESLADWLSANGRDAIKPPKSAKRGDSEAVFVNARGGRLSRSGAWLIVKGYGDSVGLGEKLTPHVLRHSCATHMLDHGADIRVVQELLGHASISTTQLYTKVSLEKLKNAYESAHPRARAK